MIDEKARSEAAITLQNNPLLKHLDAHTINNIAYAAINGYESAKAQPTEQPDERCQRCGWPIVPEGESGCWKSNCSMRPMPPLPKRKLGKEAERAELQGFINGIVTIMNCRTPSSTTTDGANTLNELRAIGDVKIGMANDELAEIRRNEIEAGEPKPIADKSPEAAIRAIILDAFGESPWPQAATDGLYKALLPYFAKK